MKKIYYLSTCDTCKRILKDLNAPSSFELQDIKKEPLDMKQLLELKHRAGTYEAIINKRARLYKERDLKNKQLSEEDYKNLLLEHYTFLKRPVIVNDQQIFAGNSKKEVAAAKDSLGE
ncbi:arsenate reductase family protein [Salinimicrobium xinjiangense]|uniref:arsenate reductase family protein n=1 Tax=Salinimicrobium xinjiangense TaxID=438596 RepID=UPI000403A7AF|nr:ArsC/Spx/MgsR family protein [Salinimicrobium xinjiangense]